MQQGSPAQSGEDDLIVQAVWSDPGVTIRSFVYAQRTDGELVCLNNRTAFSCYLNGVWPCMTMIYVDVAAFRACEDYSRFIVLHAVYNATFDAVQDFCIREGGRVYPFSGRILNNFTGATMFVSHLRNVSDLNRYDMAPESIFYGEGGVNPEKVMQFVREFFSVLSNVALLLEVFGLIAVAIGSNAFPN